MSIVRDDAEERETRVDRMIAEFRRAQWRRLVKATTVKGDGQVGRLQRLAHDRAATDATPTDFIVEL